MNLTDPIFQDADKAREHLEKVRWPEGPICPHCGVVNEATKLEGKATRPGLYKCKACRGQFTATVGTVFEDSKVPLNKWMLASYLMASSKKGISAHQLHRTIGVTYKTAWFMCHRLREAMNPADPAPLGGKGRVVEADEGTAWSQHGGGDVGYFSFAVWPPASWNGGMLRADLRISSKADTIRDRRITISISTPARPSKQTDEKASMSG